MPRSKDEIRELTISRIEHMAKMQKKRSRLQADGAKGNGLYRHFLQKY
tara:strand:+ start:958 stop:1101 length:144 start_codon:yes stop_codon:yes gene_type:complete